MFLDPRWISDLPVVGVLVRIAMVAFPAVGLYFFVKWIKSLITGSKK